MGSGAGDVRVESDVGGPDVVRQRLVMQPGEVNFVRLRRQQPTVLDVKGS
jgi:hypothetical protein